MFIEIYQRRKKIINFNPNNPATYKPARKKQYDIHMGMPAKKVIFFNKFEQPQMFRHPVFAKLNKCLLTDEELSRLDRTASDYCYQLMKLVYVGLLYGVSGETKDRVILAGTRGEMRAIQLNKLAKTYDIVNSDDSITAITPQSLSSVIKDGGIPWTRIRTKKSADVVMACFVPVEYQMQITTSWGAVLQVNAEGVPHGKGDFIMTSCNPDGTPNMNDRWVVNGLIFRDTYDNRGWSEYLENTSRGAIQKSDLEDLGIK